MHSIERPGESGRVRESPGVSGSVREGPGESWRVREGPEGSEGSGRADSVEKLVFLVKKLNIWISGAFSAYYTCSK